MDSLKVMWIALRDGAVRGLFWILLVCGLLLLAVGSFANVGDAWRDFLKTTGASILASGVFAALLKSLQFMGVFRAELAAQQQGLADDILDRVVDAVFLRDGALDHLDMEEIWKRVTTAVVGKKYPALRSEIGSQVRDDLLLGGGDGYYYRDYRYACTLSWANRAERLVKVEHSMEVEICPTSSSAFHYEYVYRERLGEADTPPNHEVTLLTVNDENRLKDVVTSTSGGMITIRYDIVLDPVEASPKTGTFLIRREGVAITALAVEPFLMSTCRALTQRATLRVRCVDEDLGVEFLEIGLRDAFQTVGDKEDKVNRNLYRRCERVLFPRQGYLLLFKQLRSDSDGDGRADAGN